MRILLISIIVLLIAGLLAFTTNSVYAPCLIGVISCGPPPGVTVSTGTDSQFYEKNDTIKVQGQVYVQNYSKSIHLLVVNPDNATIQSIDTPVTNGKFELKIGANFGSTGVYQIITCVQSWCDRSYFKFISEPYKLTTNNQDYLIKYKSYADLVGMEADITNQVLRVHVTGATAQGLQFVIDLPRALIDSKGYTAKDASFKVLIGMHQPDKYMQPANFTEIASNDLSRTLAIDIPYEPVPNSSGGWDFKISSFQTSSSGSAVLTQSPLKQFKSGIAANDVNCKQGLQLVIKAEDGSPACVKSQTAQKLVEHGWGWAMQPIKSLQPNRIIGLENDTGVVTLGNQTYYFETPNYTDTAYSNPVQISFHDVVFTLFPSGFKGGLPTSPGCGSGSVGKIVAGSGRYYWTDAKFSDGNHKLLNIFADSQPCPEHPIPTYFSNHTNPQAGLTFYDGKMKLLVSTNVANSTSPNAPEYKVGPDLLGPIPHQLVFFMKSKSTAKIFVKYTSNEPNTGTVQSYSSVYVGKGNFTPLTTSDVTINADPSSIPMAKGSDTLVVYTITAKEGVKGVYWIFLVQFCRVIPLAIDIDSLTISPFDIPVQTGVMHCPAQFLDGKILGISGGTAEYKIGQSAK